MIMCMVPLADHHVRRSREHLLPDRETAQRGSGGRGSQQVFQPNRGIVPRIHTDIELPGQGLQLAVAMAVQIDGTAMLAAP